MPLRLAPFVLCLCLALLTPPAAGQSQASALPPTPTLPSSPDSAQTTQTDTPPPSLIGLALPDEISSQWIEDQLPQAWIKNKVMGIKYWQWVALFIVILIGLIIDLITRMLLRWVAFRLARRRFIEDDEAGLRKSLRPLGLLAAAVFWMLTLYIVGLEGAAVVILNGALRVFVVLAGIASAWRVTDLTAEILAYQASRTETKLDDVLIPLLRKTLKIFIFIFGLIYGASALNISILPLITSLGLGGVAFAFAAKDTVENFFGSIAVLLDRPFDVGDWVVINDTEGIVEEVGFRSTRVRTFYNSQITIPNANLVRAIVDNYGRRIYRRWKTTLGVQYDTTPDQLIAFTEGIRELIRTHPYTRKDYYQVYCNEFGDSSLNILLYMFFEVPDWNTELRERDRLFLDIVRLADQLGINFAFPTTTVHLYKEEHQPHQTQHQPPQIRTEQQAQHQGIRAAHELTRHQPWTKHKPGPVQIQGTQSDLTLDAAGNPIESEPDTPSDESAQP